MFKLGCYTQLEKINIEKSTNVNQFKRKRVFNSDLPVYIT